MNFQGTAISLFSGAGGLDLGAETAGFSVRAAVEINDLAAQTMERNFPELESPVIRTSILDLPTSDLLSAAGLSSRESPELLIGGPPCTPFSKSGFWLDWKREGLDPTAGLLQEYTRVLREAKPTYFLLENVAALTFNNRASRPSFVRLLKEIDDAGYAFTWKVLSAADFGVPQARSRLIIMGARKGIPIPIHPTETHGTGLAPHVSTGEALSDLSSEPEEEEIVGGRWGALLPEIPPGDNYLHYTAKRGHPEPLFEWRSRYWSFLLKLDPSKPSPTIQAQPGPNVGPFHWDNRRLRIPELKRLFTFPDDFDFAGSRRAVQAQIGNSVPPVFAAAMLNELTRVGGREGVAA